MIKIANIGRRLQLVDLAILLLIAACFMSSCSRRQTQETELKKLGEKADLLISSWYLEQFVAIEVLNNELDAKIVISREDGPGEVIERQRAVVRSIVGAQEPDEPADLIFDKHVRNWVDLQFLAANRLRNGLGLSEVNRNTTLDWEDLLSMQEDLVNSLLDESRGAK